MRRTMLTVPLAGLTAAAALTACGGGDATADEGVNVIAAFYPLAFATEQVGGEGVTVTNLTPAGQEPHDIELDPSDIARVEEADYIVYLEGFIPELDTAIDEYASGRTLEIGSVVDMIGYDDTDSLEGGPGEDHEHETEDHHDHDALEGGDPHVWLDPIRYAAIGEAIAADLADIDEDEAETYTAGAAEFTAALTELDAEFTEGLAERVSDEIVTSHAAFGYLADRYGLRQIAIAGLSPDQEASSRRMARIAQFVEDHGVTTIFFETLASSSIADTIAAETGAQTAVLNPLEGLTEADGDDADYFSVMRDNLAALQMALGAA